MQPIPEFVYTAVKHAAHYWMNDKLWVDYAVFMHLVPSYALFSAGLDDLTFPNGTDYNATVGDVVEVPIIVEANPMPNFTVTHVSTVSADQPNALPVVALALGV